MDYYALVRTARENRDAAIARARSKARRVIAQATAEAKSERDAAIARARSEARRVIAQATSERDRQICELKACDPQLSLAAIGQQLGCSRTVVHEVLNPDKHERYAARRREHWRRRRPRPVA